MPMYVSEVVNIYSLIQIGVSYKEAYSIPSCMADALITLHKEIKDYESEEMEKQTKNMNKRF